MRTLRTTRKLPKETLSLEAFSGIDGQGKPSYDTAVSFEANVLWSDEFITTSDGSEVRVPLTLYVEGDETNVPAEQDHVEVDGVTFTVLERTEPRGLWSARSTPGHYRLRCRQGG